MSLFRKVCPSKPYTVSIFTIFKRIFFFSSNSTEQRQSWLGDHFWDALSYGGNNFFQSIHFKTSFPGPYSFRKWPVESSNISSYLGSTCCKSCKNTWVYKHVMCWLHCMWWWRLWNMLVVLSIYLLLLSYFALCCSVAVAFLPFALFPLLLFYCYRCICCWGRCWFLLSLFYLLMNDLHLSDCTILELPKSAMWTGWRWKLSSKSKQN